MSGDAQERLISAGRQLMLERGYAGTGINDICVEAGVSKGAFYHSFPTKEALAIAALDSFYRRGVEELSSIDVSAAAPADRLPLFVERLAGRASVLWKHGCLIGGLASEMALASDELQRHVARQFDELAAIVARVAEPYVQALGLPGISATSVAEDLLAFIEGIIVLSRAHRDPRRLKAPLERYAAGLRAMRAR